MIPARQNQENQLIDGLEFQLEKHFAHFENRFPGELKVFHHLGMHPFQEEAIENPFLPGDKANFRNIGEHSLAVAFAAKTIARNLIEVEALSFKDYRRIILRALLHDVHKPYHVMYWRIFGISSDTSLADNRVIQNLVKTSLPSYLIQELLTAGNETGHLGLRELLEIDSQGTLRLKNGMLAFKLVHLADALAHSTLPSETGMPMTVFVCPSERMAYCKERYRFLTEEGMMADDCGRISFLTKQAYDQKNSVERGKWLGSFYELHRFVAEEIAKEFTMLLAPGSIPSSSEAEDFILHLLELGIRNLVP